MNMPSRKWYDLADERLANIAYQRDMRVRARSLRQENSTWKVYATEQEIKEMKGDRNA